MAIFPDGTGLKPLYEDYESGEMENVIRNEPRSGKAMRRDVWMGRTRFWATFTLELALAFTYQVMAFWRTNRALTFTFYDFDTDRFPDESIGTGDGSNLTFTIPAKETTNQTVMVNGTPWLEVTHWNITAGTGALGEDRVIFTTGNAPANGIPVTITYDGRHRYTCEWDGPPSKPVVSGNGRHQIRVRVREAF